MDILNKLDELEGLIAPRKSLAERYEVQKGSGSLPIGWELLQRIGKVYHVSNPGQIIDDVFHAVEDWRDIFREYEVPVSDIQKLNHEIQQRIMLIENPDSQQGLTPAR